jgi:hypothetical protein
MRSFVRPILVLLAAGSVACGGGRESNRPASPPSAAASAPVGRIHGTVTLVGSIPAARSEAVAKDTDVCGRSVQLTRLSVGRDNGVQNAFVYLDGIESSAPVTPAASLTIEQKGCEYAPHAMMLHAGAGVDIVNGDAILHNVHAKQMTADGLQTVFNIAQPVRGTRTKVDTPLKPGIVALTCEAGHPWMTAYILVSDNPFATVTTADDGSQSKTCPRGATR